MTGNISNASASFASAPGSTFVLIGAVAVVFAIVVTMLVSQRAYRALLDASGAFARSVEYAIKGVVTAVAAGVVVVPVYAVSQVDASTRGAVLRLLAIGVVGYGALVVLGVVGDSVWARVKDRHERATGHAPFENWGEAGAGEE